MLTQNSGARYRERECVILMAPCVPQTLLRKLPDRKVPERAPRYGQFQDYCVALFVSHCVLVNRYWPIHFSLHAGHPTSQMPVSSMCLISLSPNGPRYASCRVFANDIKCGLSISCAPQCWPQVRITFSHRAVVVTQKKSCIGHNGRDVPQKGSSTQPFVTNGIFPCLPEPQFASCVEIVMPELLLPAQCKHRLWTEPLPAPLAVQLPSSRESLSEAPLSAISSSAAAIPVRFPFGHSLPALRGFFHSNIDSSACWSCCSSSARVSMHNLTEALDTTCHPSEERSTLWCFFVGRVPFMLN